jgi:hypothetical protein
VAPDDININYWGDIEKHCRYWENSKREQINPVSCSTIRKIAENKLMLLSNDSIAFQPTVQ